MIRLWYCPLCGPPTYANTYSHPTAGSCVFMRDHRKPFVETPHEVAVGIIAKFHPETVTEIAKEQGVTP